MIGSRWKLKTLAIYTVIYGAVGAVSWIPVQSSAQEAQTAQLPSPSESSSVDGQPAAPTVGAPARDSAPVSGAPTIGATASPSGPIKEAIVSRLELVTVGTSKISIQLLPARVPFDVKVDDQQQVSLKAILTSSTPELSILMDNRVIKFQANQATLEFKAPLGDSRMRFSAIDGFGNVGDYEIATSIAARTVAAVGEPAGFWIVGPAVYTRSVNRSGTALTTSNSYSGLVSGVRGIVRLRILRELLDHLPGKFKMYWDSSGTVGLNLSGDTELQGMPIFGDTRLTLEIFQKTGLRMEGGAGFSLFIPGLKRAQAGDLSSFLAFSLSGRLGYVFGPKLFGLMGVTASLPSSTNTDRTALVSNSLEFFVAGSTPLAPGSYLEIRLKYWKLSTTGAIVAAGNFEKSESMIGPEFLWVHRF